MDEDYDDECEDFTDEYYYETAREMCDCGQVGTDNCGFCGKPLCGMCFETGAGFCHATHTREQINEYSRRLYK